jgi:hypothetical protein
MSCVLTEYEYYLDWLYTNGDVSSKKKLLTVLRTFDLNGKTVKSTGELIKY